MLLGHPLAAHNATTSTPISRQLHSDDCTIISGGGNALDMDLNGSMYRLAWVMCPLTSPRNAHAVFFLLNSPSTGLSIDYSSRKSVDRLWWGIKHKTRGSPSRQGQLVIMLERFRFGFLARSRKEPERFPSIPSNEYMSSKSCVGSLAGGSTHMLFAFG